MSGTKFSIITGSGSFEAELPGDGWTPVANEYANPFIVVFEENNKENN